MEGSRRAEWPAPCHKNDSRPLLMPLLMPPPLRRVNAGTCISTRCTIMIRTLSSWGSVQANPCDSVPKSLRSRLGGGSAITPLPLMNGSSPADTHPAVEAMLIEGFRGMSPSQKLERVRALNQAVQELALLDIRRRHPDAGEREQRSASVALDRA